MDRIPDEPRRRRGYMAVASACVAAALIVASVFLPKLALEAGPLVENRLIDRWEGVALIGCAALVLLGAVLGRWRRRWGWLVFAAGAAALGIVLYASTGARLFVGGPGGPFEGPTIANPGIGLMVAGAAALLAIATGPIAALGVVFADGQIFLDDA